MHRLLKIVCLVALVCGFILGCTTPAATEVITAVPHPEETEPESEETTSEPDPTGTPVVAAEEGPAEAAASDVVDAPVRPVVVFSKSEGEDAGASIWAWRPGMVPVMLAQGGSIIDSILVSDDGEVAVFQRRRLEDPQTSSLWAVNTDGSHERELLSAEGLLPMVTYEDGWGASITYMDFAADTHTLLFTTQTRIDAPGVYVNADLWLIDADTGELMLLQEPTEAFQQDFVISPDGSQVAVITDEAISVVAMDGSSRIDNLLTYDAAPTGEAYMLASAAWTADGSSLLVAVPPEDIFAAPPLPHRLLQVPLDGGPAVELAQFSDDGLFGAFFNGDGSAFAYLEELGAAGDNTWALHVVTENGAKDDVVLTEPYQRFIGWDPDNERYYAYQTTQQQVYTGRVGEEPVLLEDVVFNAEDWIRNPIQWIDAEILVYVSYTPDGATYALWRVTPGHVPGIIIQLDGEPAYFIPRLAVAP